MEVRSPGVPAIVKDRSTWQLGWQPARNIVPAVFVRPFLPHAIHLNRAIGIIVVVFDIRTETTNKVICYEHASKIPVSTKLVFSHHLGL